MTNFAKVLDQLVTTADRVLEAREENDPKQKHIIRVNSILCIG